MDGTFSLFRNLPPELRHKIWRHAFAQQPWSVTRLQRVVGRPVRLRGDVHRAVSQACREARAVMQATHTEVDPFGWIDFGRHLFVFRDAESDRRLMLRAAGLLAHVQHMMLNPRDWPRLWTTLDDIKSRCASLRSLVVVAPWHEPPDAAAGPDALHLAPYEDWRLAFRETPAELDLSPLLDDIERGGAASASRIAQYWASLDQAVRRLPSDVSEIDNAYGRTRAVLQRLEQATQEFPGTTPPRLYLRRRDELNFSRLLIEVPR